MLIQIKKIIAILLAVYFFALLTVAAVSAESVTLFEDYNFEGDVFDVSYDPIQNPECKMMQTVGSLNDKVSSIQVESGTWRFYEDANYGGRYWDLGPGQYPCIDELGGEVSIPCDIISSFRLVSEPIPVISGSEPSWPGIILYEDPYFEGNNQLSNSDDVELLFSYIWDVNEKIFSSSISSGTWRLYEDEKFGGRYWDLGPGKYDLISDVGIPCDVISSVRLIPPNTALLDAYSITLFEGDFFEGDTYGNDPGDPEIRMIQSLGYFDDKASSYWIKSGTWRLYEDENFGGNYWDLGPGEYHYGNSYVPNDIISSFRLVSEPIPDMNSDVPYVVLFEDPYFEGNMLKSIYDPYICPDPSLPSIGINEKISSILISSGTWRFYEDANYGGRYWDLGPGQYDLISDVGIPCDVISSVQLTSNETEVVEEETTYSVNELIIQ